MLEVTARAGSPLPPIPDDVREALYDWLGTRSDVSAISASNIADVKRFRRDVGWRDWAKPIYRGLTINLDSLRKLLEGGTLSLRPRAVESWTMNPASSLRFMRPQWETSWFDRAVVGVLLSKPRPKPGSIVMDAPQFYLTYAGTEHDAANPRSGTEEYIAHMRDQFTRECEIIVEQQCRTCTLEDVEGICIQWVKWAGDDAEYTRLLKGRGLANLFGVKGERWSSWDDVPEEYLHGGAKDGLIEYRDSGAIFLRIGPGGSLDGVPEITFRSSMWPPDDAARRDFRALPGWRNRPAPLSGHCPKIDLSRR